MPTDRPNILLVMCDQLNAGVLGCYGGLVPTPNIDRLASAGAVFTNASCPTPFCSPSRASLLTGLYPHSLGIVANVNRRDYPAIGGPTTEAGIGQADVTTESMLSADGYQTHHYGKWHLAGDNLDYFPDMFGEHHEYAGLMADTFEEVRRGPREDWLDWYGWALPVTVSPPLRTAVDALGDKWSGQAHAEFITRMGRLDLPLEQNFDVLVADRTCERLRALDDRPFMVTCSFNYPHDPNVVPSPYYESVDPAAIELPENSGVRESRFEGDWSRRIVSDLGEAGAREFLRIYYTSVRLIDDQVGRVLDALDATGRARDTIVLFTADHGDMAGGHGMVWKSTSAFYDDVARVPLIIRYPRAIRPHESSIEAGLTDVMPTLLELTGHSVPDHVQGHCLAPYITGRADPSAAPPFRFSERVPPNRERTLEMPERPVGSFMVRGHGSKYVRYSEGEEFLYDLTTDPSETRDLSSDPAHAERKAALAAELDGWLTETW